MNPDLQAYIDGLEDGLPSCRRITGMSLHEGSPPGGRLGPGESFSFEGEVWLSHPVKDKDGLMWDDVDINLEGFYREKTVLMGKRFRGIDIDWDMEIVPLPEGARLEEGHEVKRMRITYTVTNNSRKPVAFGKVSLNCCRLGVKDTLSDFGIGYSRLEVTKERYLYYGII